MNQHELTAGLASGDEEAWRVFLRDYGRLVFAVVNRFTGVADERDDLFQDACLAVFRGVRTLRDPDRLATWVYRTTYRLCIDAGRRRRPRFSADSLETPPPSEGLQSSFPLPGEDLERLEKVAILRDAVDRLDPECRNLLTIMYLGASELSYKQISGGLGMPIGSIGPTRARCLEKAKRLYESLSDPGRRASIVGEHEKRGVGDSGVAGSGSRPGGRSKAKSKKPEREP